MLRIPRTVESVLLVAIEREQKA